MTETQITNQELQRELQRKYIRRCTKAGIRRICRSRVLGGIFFVSLLAWPLAGYTAVQYYQLPGVLLIPWCLLYFVLLLPCCWALGFNFDNWAFERNFRRIGFYNSAHEVPFLLDKHPSKSNPRVTVYMFESYGISLDRWRSAIPELQSANNLVIAGIAQGRNQRTVFLYTLPGHTTLPEKLAWSWDCCNPCRDLIVLGKSLLGDVQINLELATNIIIGGGTGSGKTSLLKCILAQCVHNKERVILCDFKGVKGHGSIDFGSEWEKHIEIVTSYSELQAKLTELTELFQLRKKLWASQKAISLPGYNCKVLPSQQQPRVILAIDEMAMLTMTTDKEEKEQCKQILADLKLLMAQGRAFGFNTILCTQRPDVATIPGDLKSNAIYRVCGRADNVLSMLILDNTSACELVPKDAQGRFVDSEGNVYQAYYFDDVLLNQA